MATPGVTTITLAGSGLSADGLGHVYYQATWGQNTLYQSLGDIISWTDSQIIFKAPTDLKSGQLQFDLKYGGTKYLGPWLYTAPTVSSITTASEVYSDVASIGSIVTIKGKNFTSTQGKVLFSGVEGQNQSWTDTEIKVIVPVGASDGKITIKVYNQNTLDYSISVDLIGSIYIYPTLSNDPLASNNQWWISKIKANEAWSETTGSSNVVVAVIDSGVDTNHFELTNNIWTNSDEIAGNGKDDDNNGYVDDTHGWDFISKRNEMSPYNSHGTHVAGIIVAAGNNSAGVASIAWSTKIMPVIVCGSSGCTGDITTAIKYAVDNGANIINLSLGGSGWTNDYSAAYDEAITYAYARNVVVVAAAGNGDYTGAQPRNLNVNPSSPVCNNGKYNMIIGVAATNVVDTKADFSDYGSNCIDVSAPGKDIFSTVRPIDDSNYSSTYNPAYIGYKTNSGTSMAAPMVSGLAALIKAKYPQVNAAQIIDMIRRGADSIDSLNPSYAGQIGTGRINVVKTLELNPDPNIALPDLILPVDLTGYYAYGDNTKSIHLGDTAKTGPHKWPEPYFEWTGATDSGSGVKGYYVLWTTDKNADAVAGILQTGSSFIAPRINSKGMYYLLIKTVDNNGNISPGSYITYNADPDLINPTIQTKNSTKAVKGKYYSSKMAITITSEDANGSPSVYYHWDDEPYSVLSGKTIKARAGRHTLYYYAADQYGNKTDEKRVVYNVVLAPYESVFLTQSLMPKQNDLQKSLSTFKVMNIKEIKAKPIRFIYSFNAKEAKEKGAIYINKKKISPNKLTIAYYDKKLKKWIPIKTAVSKKLKFVEAKSDKIEKDALFGVFVKN